MQMEEKRILRFAFAVLKGRWMVVVASFFIMSTAGATYIFGLYSGAIKSSLKYSQQTLDTLGFFKDLGANVGIISGLLNEVTPSWFVLAIGAGLNVFGYLMTWLAVTDRIAPPKLWQMYLYICIGANSQTFANTGIMVTCVKNFPQSRGIVIGLLKGCVGLSGAIITQLYHALYKQNSSSLILLVAWFPALISLLFLPFIRLIKVQSEEKDNRNFYSFLYLALTLAGFLMVLIVIENEISFPQAGYIAAAVVTFLMIAANVGVAVRSELDKTKDSQVSNQGKTNLVSSISRKSPLHVNGNFIEGKGDIPGGFNGEKVQVSSLESPGMQLEQKQDAHQSENLAIKLPSDATRAPTYQYTHSTGDAADHSRGQRDIVPMEHVVRGKISVENHVELVPSKPSQSGETKSSRNIEQYNKEKTVNKKEAFKIGQLLSKWPKRGDDYTILQALLSFDMWILFVASTCGIGAALTAIDNMGQIGDSLGYTRVSISTFVSLISIWNFLGRVIAGFSSEILLQRYRFPRPLMLTIILGMASIAHLLIASGLPGSLYFASILIGLCFGAQWPILFAVISELFGLRYFATLYNFGAVASPLGTYLLSVKVAGHLYDKEARKQMTELMITRSDLVCKGKSCFRVTFFIMAAVTLLGSLVSLILVWRTKEFYKQDIYAKFRQQNDTEDPKPLQL